MVIHSGVMLWTILPNMSKPMENRQKIQTFQSHNDWMNDCKILDAFVTMHVMLLTHPHWTERLAFRKSVCPLGVDARPRMSLCTFSLCPDEFLPSWLMFSRRCCQYFLWPQGARLRHDSQLWRSSCQSSFGSSPRYHDDVSQVDGTIGPCPDTGLVAVTASVVCINDWTYHVSTWYL